MKAKDHVFITEVTQKTSGQGNQYFLIDFTETLPLKDEKGQPITKQWTNVFFTPAGNTIAPQNFKGKEAVIIINFYTYNRKVGENVYTDIKCNIVEIGEKEEQ